MIMKLRQETESQRRFEPTVQEHLRLLNYHDDLSNEAEAVAALTPHVRRLAATLFRSPMYLERFKALGLSPHDLYGVHDFAAFPVLLRREVAQHWRNLVVLPERDDEASEWAVVRSSGSTGEPVDVLRNRYELVLMWGMLRYWIARLGIELPPKPRVVLLCTLPARLEYEADPPLLHDGRLYRISVRSPQAARRLLEIRPDVVFSDPSGLHWLAGLSLSIPARLYLSSAQHLSPTWRARLNAPLMNYYSSTETGPLAWECLQVADRYHVLSPDVWIESVNSALYVTRLRPSPWPLLRYETGDHGDVAFGTCACGVSGWSITRFTGRHACWFVRPDGTRIDAWQLAPVFKKDTLHSFQFTQTDVNAFELWTTHDATDLLPALTHTLRELGWPDPQVTMGAAISVVQDKPCAFVCALPP